MFRSLNLEKAVPFRDPKLALEQYLVNLSHYTEAQDYIEGVVKGKKLLDLCAGTGGMSISLLRFVKSVLAVDIDSEALEDYRNSVPDSLIAKIDFKVGDVRREKFRDYDVVICNPPFGDIDRQNFVNIIVSINYSKIKEVFILISEKNMDMVISLLANYGKVKEISLSVNLPKTYEHHTRELVFIKCKMLHFVFIGDRDADELEISEEYKMIIDDSLKVKLRTLANRAGVLRRMFLSPFYIVSDAEGMRLIFGDMPEETDLITLEDASELFNNTIEISILPKDVSLIDYNYILSSFMGIKIVSEKYQMISRFFYLEITAYAFQVGLSLYNYKKEGQLLRLEQLGKIDSNSDIQEDKFIRLGFKDKIKYLCVRKFMSRLLNYKDMVGNSSRTIQEMDVLRVQYLGLNEWTSAVKAVNGRQLFFISDKEFILNITKAVNALENLQNSSKEEEVFLRFKKRSQILTEFFQNTEVHKAISESGIVISLNTVGSLLDYISKKMNRPDLDDTDRESLLYLRKRTEQLLSADDQKPLSLIINTSLRSLYDVKQLLPATAVEGFDALVLKFKHSISYEECWQYTLRLKGYIYEAFFAESHKLPFVNEPRKLNLERIIYEFFPEKYSEFCRRCQAKPFIKEYTPDFFLCNSKESDITLQSKIREEGTSSDNESDIQLVLDEMDTKEKKEYLSKLAQSINSKHDLFKAHKKETADVLIDLAKQQGKTETNSASILKEGSIESSSYLVIIEVGYVTANEGKVANDARKWDVAMDILSSISIDTKLVCVSDSTNSLMDSVWINDEFKKVMKSCTPKIFGSLSPNIPPEQTQKISGDISTASLRSMIRTGRPMKTPISDEDVIQYVTQNKEAFFVRPSGVTIPEVIQKKFAKNLVLGSVMRNSTAIDIKNLIITNKEKIVSYVEKSPLVFERLNSLSYIKFLYGSFSDLIKSKLMSASIEISQAAKEIVMCLKQSKINETQLIRMEDQFHLFFRRELEIGEIKLKELKTLKKSRDSFLENDTNKIARKTSVSDSAGKSTDLDASSQELVEKRKKLINPKMRKRGSRTVESSGVSGDSSDSDWERSKLTRVKEQVLKQSQLGKVLGILCWNTNLISQDYTYREVDKTNLDKLCSLVLPGKSGREKEIKGKVFRLVELFSIERSGFYRDKKGLIISSFRDILYKSGVRGNPPESLLDKIEGRKKKIVDVVPQVMKDLLSENDKEKEVSLKLIPEKTSTEIKKIIGITRESEIKESESILKNLKKQKEVDSRHRSTGMRTSTKKALSNQKLKLSSLENDDIRELDEVSMDIFFSKDCKKTTTNKVSYTVKKFAIKVISEIDKILLKADSIPEESVRIITGFRSDICSVIQNAIVDIFTPNELLMILGSGSYIESPNLNQSINMLLTKSVYKDPLNKIFDQRRERFEKFSGETSSQYGNFSHESIQNIQTLSVNLCKDDIQGNSPDYIPKFMKDYIESFYKEYPIYSIAIEMVLKLFKILMTTRFFRTLYIYSKICLQYNNFVSEMSSAGLKLMKVPGVDMNLLCQISKKKNTNSPCMLLDSEFRSMTKPFFLNRGLATLGQSLCSVLMVNILQILQNTRSVDILSSDIVEVCSQLNTIIEEWSSEYVKVSEIVSQGNFKEFCNKTNELQSRVKEKTREEGKEGLFIISSYICSYSFFTLVPLVLNKRRVSKLMQMYRYPLVLSLSTFGFPEGVGTKLCMTYRSAEERMFHIYETFCGAINIKNNESILEGWTLDHTYNATRVLSLQIYPNCCETERQLLSDMYICHIYNKMMDDFGEGSIRVANETFEKIFEFESSLATNVSKMNSPESSSSERSTAKRRILMLLGVKDISIKKCQGIESMLVREGEKNEHLLPPRSSSRTSAMSMDDSSSSSSGGSGASSSSSVVSSYDNFLKSSSKAKSLKSLASNNSGRIDHYMYHSADSSYIMETIYDCSRKMHKYSFGCPEVVQAAYELAKHEYNNLNIVRALSDKLNNSQISKITETTSIISEPIYNFNLGQSLKIVQDREKVKLSKTLTRTLRQSVQMNVKQKTFTAELSKLILTEEESFEKQKDKVLALYTDLRKESKWKWTDICNSTYKSVIGSDNCNNLFTFIKTLWREIRKLKTSEQNYWSLCSELNESIFSLFLEEEGRKSFKQLLSLKDQNRILGKTVSLRDELANNILNECMKKYGSNIEASKKKFWAEAYKLSMLFEEAENLFLELKLKESQFPSASFPEIHNKILGIENEIQDNYHEVLFPLCLIFLGCQMLSPINMNTKNSLASVIKLNKKLIDYSEEEMKAHFNSSDSKGSIEDYLNLSKASQIIYNLSECSCFMINYFNSHSGNLCSSSSTLAMNYIQLLLLKIDRPFESRIAAEDINIENISGLSNAIKSIISRSSVKATNFDFMMMVTDCIRGGLAICKRLLERKEKNMVLPRSTRSKVIYEMIKIAKSYGTTSIQSLGFTFMIDPTHRFYAGIAPKAQIGGDRDLQVLEKKSKVAIHVIESCSKSLLKCCSSSDGLTNPSKKNEMLQYSQVQMTMARGTHKVERGSEKSFLKVLNINGDCAKWGPIHNLSFFLNGIIQLLIDFKDVACAYRLVFLKGVTRLLEIPNAVREKIVGSLISDPEFRSELNKISSVADESMKRKLMVQSVERNWNNNLIVNKLVKWYLSKGEVNVTSYNHMGQGIFHATSSLHGDVCYTFLLSIVRQHIEDLLPGFTVSIKRVSSSDDYNICITVYGSVPSVSFNHANHQYDKAMVSALNLMSGLMRACQMRVSEKTCASPILSEFYSEFCFIDRVSPATMKYYTNQIINNSVSSPLSLYQACHVECQQAFYNGVPMTTIIAMAVMKQLIFVTNSEEIYERYGYFIMNSLTTIGRLYLPTYTIMISSSPAMEDLSVLYNVCQHMIKISEDESSISRKGREFDKDNDVYKTSRIITLEDSSVDDEQRLKESEVKNYINIPKGVKSLRIQESETSSEDDLTDVGTIASGQSENDFLVETRAITSSQMSLVSDEELDLKRTKVSLTDLLTIIMFKYYTGRNDIQTKEGFNKLRSKEPDTPLIDPFIQMVPESVRSEVSRLRAYKKEIEVEEKIINTSKDSLELVGRLCLAQSIATEDYDIELSRLLQALSSKDVIWGLTGGSRELSIPFFRQMMRAYFFMNLTPLSTLSSWSFKSSSEFTSGGQKIPPSQRIKFIEFLRGIDSISVIFEDDFETFETEKFLFFNDFPLKFVEIIEKNDFRFGLTTNDIELIHDYCRKTITLDELKKQVNISAFSKELTSFATTYKSSVRYALVINRSKLLMFRDFIIGIIDPMRDSMFTNLLELERMRNISIADSKRTVMTKGMFSKSDGRKVFKNNVSLIISNILSYRSLPEAKPSGARFEEISSDTDLLINSYHSFYKNLILLKEELIKHDKLESLKYIKSIVSKLVSTCRVLSGTKSGPIGAYCLTEEKSDLTSVTTSSLVTNNIIEGKKLKGDSEVVDRSHDDFLYTLKGCIACINWIGNSDDERKTLLLRFLRVNLKQFIESLGSINNCTYVKFLKEFYYRIPEGTVSSLFEMESHRLGKEKQRNIRNLARLEGNMTNLIMAYSPSNLRPQFIFRGSVKNGVFSFSCAEGTCTGLIKDSIVYITLSSPSSILLSSLEGPILSLFGHESGNTSPEELKSLLYKLLPKVSENKFANMYYVFLQRKMNFFMKSSLTVQEKEEQKARYVFVANQKLANSVKEVDYDGQDIIFRWSDKKLKVEVRTRAKSIDYADSVYTLQTVMKKLVDKSLSDRIIKSISSGDKTEEVLALDLPQVAPKESSAIIHCLIKHKILLLHHHTRLELKDNEIAGDDVSITESIEDDEDMVGSNRLSFLSKDSETKENSELVERILTNLPGLQSITPIILILDFFRIPFESLDFKGYTTGQLDPRGDWKLEVNKGQASLRYWKLIDDFILVRECRLSKSTSFLMAECDWSDLYKEHLEEFIELISSYRQMKAHFYAPIYLFSLLFMGNIYTHFPNKIKRPAIFIKRLSMVNPSLKATDPSGHSVSIDKVNRKLELSITYHVRTLTNMGVKKKKEKLAEFVRGRPALSALFDQTKKIPGMTYHAAQILNETRLQVKFDLEQSCKGEKFFYVIIESVNIIQSVQNSESFCNLLLSIIMNMTIDLKDGTYLLPELLREAYREGKSQRVEALEEEIEHLDEDDIDDILRVLDEKDEEEPEAANQDQGTSWADRSELMTMEIEKFDSDYF